MDISQILRYFELILKTADFSVLLDAFKQLIPLLEKMFSALFSMFG